MRNYSEIYLAIEKGMTLGEIQHIEIISNLFLKKEEYDNISKQINEHRKIKYLLPKNKISLLPK